MKSQSWPKRFVAGILVNRNQTLQSKKTSSGVSGYTSSHRHPQAFSLICVLLLATVGCQRGNTDSRTKPPKEQPQAAVILGGSMAPALLGEHFKCRCADCGFKFEFDSANAPKEAAVCPNCGHDDNAIDDWTLMQADEVELFDTEALHRLDIVAFRHPERENEYGVKRIVGLPGEKVEIKGGDLFVDGKIVRKDLRQQEDMAITVFDANAVSQNTQRWSATEKNTGWSATGDELSFDETKRTTDDPFKLHYLHIRGYKGRVKSTDKDAVEDFYGYNQTKVRALNRVRDLAVMFDLNGRTEGEFVVAFDHLEEPITVSIIFEMVGDARSLRIKVDARGQAVKDAGIQLTHRSIPKIYISLFDKQIVIAVDNHTAIQMPCEFSLNETATKSPLHFVGRSGSFSLSQIKIFRDVHYLGPGNSARPWTVAGADYVLLGDNVPISLDSRNWETPRLPASEIIGNIKKRR